MARPKGSEKPVDVELLKKMARCGATQIEIAAVLGMSVGTLERRLRRPDVRGLYEQGRNDLFISLRTKQVQLALAGNPTMLIWLGKQYLDQKDRSDNTHRDPDGKPLLTLATIDRILAEEERASPQPA